MAAGIHKFTVQESQNVGLGQGGVAYISTGATYTPPSNTVVVATDVVPDNTVTATYSTPAAATPVLVVISLYPDCPNCAFCASCTVSLCNPFAISDSYLIAALEGATLLIV